MMKHIFSDIMKYFFSKVWWNIYILRVMKHIFSKIWWNIYLLGYDSSSSQLQYYILTLTLCAWSHVTRLYFDVYLLWNHQISQNSGSCNEKCCESFLRKKREENAETIFVQFTLTLFSCEKWFVKKPLEKWQFWFV